MKHFFLIILTLSSLLSFSQNIDLGFQSTVGTKSKMPFWFWANQMGRIDPNHDSNQRLSFSINDQWTSDNKWIFSYLATFDATHTDETKVKVIELAGKVNWKFLALTAGRFAEKELYDGLSSSNGDLFSSRNARPHTRVRAGFDRYVSIIPNWLAIKGHFEEGILDDDRYVKDTHLHYKQLFLRLGEASSFQVEMGMNHFVMWGGTSAKHGKLPGFSDYFRYITGSSGGKNALDTDKENVLGNQFGTYQLILTKEWENWKAKAYMSHPFEDRSGMEFVNHKDNLLGFYISRKKDHPLFKSFVIEYIHTRNQSGKVHLAWSENKQRGTGRGGDNYLNNGVYASGATFEQMVMGSPLFGPVKFVDGQSRGISNNRIEGFHIGAKGYFSPQLQWTGKVTFTDNGGTQSASFSSRKQLATMGELTWNLKELPLAIRFAGALDHGSLWDTGKSTTRLGAQLGISWHIK
ncbi:hypothetical protein EMN47_09575 [Prolixibacteraceae bacterium JC049]|nr:hypothetical protein [Prolixibacteraceae bacterium JC049]